MVRYHAPQGVTHMTTYKIVRFYQRDANARETIETGLTLEEAQEHCSDPESSSRTCTFVRGILLTETRGPWFDGYDEE
jgi:hypothetical protein